MNLSFQCSSFLECNSNTKKTLCSAQTAVNAPRWPDSAHAAARTCLSATHTFGDVTVELVEDLLDGLHVGLQVPGVVTHSGHRRGQNRVQIKAQNAVYGLAGEGSLKEGGGDQPG